VSPVRITQAVSPNLPVAFARVDHHLIAFIQTDVRDERPASVGREEEKVAALQPPARRVADSRLLNRPSWVA
jgi:hypothetical protein